MSSIPFTSITSLSEAEALLREGLRRIASVQSDIAPGAQNPIAEALQISEEQAMATLAAVERGQAAVAQIRNANNQFIDTPLATIAESFAEILSNQQAQDLAGQRLKKALTLLQAVEQRIATALADLRMLQGAGFVSAESPADDAPANGQATALLMQADVDDLLAELGI